jgi:molybdate transport system substrate-binding protein
MHYKIYNTKRVVMRLLWCVLFIALCCGASLCAQTLRIAAAADLQQALPELVQAFRVKHPNASMEAVYGSSGNFVTQIVSGAPFDVFLSADMRYPENLNAKGMTTAKPRRYAVGTLVVWVGKQTRTNIDDAVQKTGLAVVNDPRVRRVAIANPAHAPYGERAKEALEAKNLWSAVQKRLVLADNVAQAAQFAQTLNVDVAIISLSLALTPAMQKAGSYAPIDRKLYTPLEQGIVALKRSSEPMLANEFVEYVCSPEGASILARYGFSQ